MSHNEYTHGPEFRKADPERRKAAWEIRLGRQLAEPLGRRWHDFAARELEAGRCELVAVAEHQLRRMVGPHVDSSEAEDLVQEAMLDAATYAWEKGRGNLMALAHRSVRCGAIDLARRRERRGEQTELSRQRQAEALAEPMSERQYAAGQEAEEREALERRMQALLAPTQWDAVCARLEHGNPRDAAQALGISYTAFTSRMGAARKKLRAADPERFGWL